MANFPKTPPAVGRSTGLRGQNGNQGATGNGAVFTSVDSLHASPRGVADWGPTINTAIAAGTRRFIFGPYTYPFSTKIAGAGSGLYLQGSGTSPGLAGAPGGTGGTTLQWTGTGSGYAIDNTLYAFAVFRDFTLTYTSSSYTGAMIHVGGENSPGGTATVFEGCYFESTGSITTAKCAISLKDEVNVVCRDCVFGTGWSTAAIRGREAVDAWANVARFEYCHFDGQAIANPGPNWLLEQCTFECGGLSSGVSAIYMDFIPGTYPPSLILDGCSFWDAQTTGHAIVSMPASLHCDFTAINCEDFNGPYMTRTYELLGTGNVTIIGGTVNNPVDFGAGAPGVSFKSKIYIAGVVIGAALVNLNAGHGAVTVTGSPNVTAGGQTRLSHLISQRTNPATVPTVALHAGTTNLALGNMVVSEMAGVIKLDNGSGSPSSTGDILDITFGYAPAMQVTGHEQLLAVQLTEGWVSGSGWGTAGAASAAIAAGIYWHIADNDFTKFSVGIVNAIPAGASISFTYQIVFLEPN